MTTLASMSLVRSPALTLTHGIPGLIYLEDLAPEGHSDGMMGGLMELCIDSEDVPRSYAAHQSEFSED